MSSNSNIVSHFFQKELISGDQNGNIRVWDLAANSCSCELVSYSNSDFSYNV